MNTNVLWAIFKRNFFAYFASPTGYVFICVFVLLSSFAAFWPDEFFNANLANLDQLNKVLPWIMLIFIPSITMGVWADERRQGTDELVLTIPAGDFEVVLGKYLAATAIFSVALLFSLVSNYVVLGTLGNPDPGLFVGTYVGYWLVGVAMLAVGMVASFLTSNLTVAFILGAVFNAPLAFASAADTILGPRLALAVQQWSVGYQFRDFGRGIIGLSGLAYFLGIVAVMLYLSMVLIGRRHWARGRSTKWMGLHYLGRTLSLGVVVAALVVFFTHYSWLRLDVTSEGLNSLSPKTGEILAELETEQPIVVDAFVSPVVPEEFVETRLNLLAMLREFEARSGNQIEVNVHDTDPLSDAAQTAKHRFGITGQEVAAETRGTSQPVEIFMGLAFTSGVNRVVVPFIGRNAGIEYELIRSVVTVQKKQRKRVGIVKTDLVRPPDPMAMQFGMAPQAEYGAPWVTRLFVPELRKEFDVVELDPNQPLPLRSGETEANAEEDREDGPDDASEEENKPCDVILAIQPSLLMQPALDNLINAVTSGAPTVIFEDVRPIVPRILPTGEPRLPQGRPRNQMEMQQFTQMMQAMAKGDISQLWDVLWVEYDPNEIVWQDYRPSAKWDDYPPGFVFLDANCGADEPFNPRDSITADLEQMMFAFPGALSARETPAKPKESELPEIPQREPGPKPTFTPLVTTAPESGEVEWDDFFEMADFGRRRPKRIWDADPTDKSYTLAALIGSGNDNPQDDQSEAKGKKKSKLNVALVADLDMLFANYFAPPGLDSESRFDSLPFLLNTLDAMTAGEKLLEIRNRRPKHRTLSRIQAEIKEAKTEARQARKEARDEYQEAKEKAEEERKQAKEELEEREDLNPWLKGIAMDATGSISAKKEAVKQEQLDNKLQQNLREIETELAVDIRQIQDRYKIWAVVLPPIPPLLVAVLVFFIRRAREYEGVSKSRLR